MDASIDYAVLLVDNDLGTAIDQPLDQPLNRSSESLPSEACRN